LEKSELAERTRGQYLAEALEREREERRNNRNERVLRASGFPLEKSLESIDREQAAAICSIASTAKTTKAATWVISTSTTEGLEGGGYPSTIVPRKVQPRSSSKEFYMMLGGYFMDSFKCRRSDC